MVEKRAECFSQSMCGWFSPKLNSEMVGFGAIGLDRGFQPRMVYVQFGLHIIWVLEHSYACLSPWFGVQFDLNMYIHICK